MLLHTAEKAALAIILAVFAISGVMDLSAGTVHWPDYMPRIAFGAALIFIGLAYRALNRSEGVALTTIATGLFILFTLFGSVLNYLLFPLSKPTIDPQLAAIDAWFGYSWPRFVGLTGEVPLLGNLLAQVYMSSLFQLIVIILLLGFTRNALALHRFLLTGMFGALIAIGIWWIAPSFGPSAMFDIPQDVMERVSLVVQPSYGAELLRLASEGPVRISPDDVLGVIAFPSFHTVMACMAVWFTFKTFAGPGFMLVNILMVPAILAHGGHHLVDVVGGVTVFAAALGIAAFIVRPRPERTAVVPADTIVGGSAVG